MSFFFVAQQWALSRGCLFLLVCRFQPGAVSAGQRGGGAARAPATAAERGRGAGPARRHHQVRSWTMVVMSRWLFSCFAQLSPVRAGVILACGTRLGCSQFSWVWGAFADGLVWRFSSFLVGCVVCLTRRCTTRKSSRGSTARLPRKCDRTCARLSLASSWVFRADIRRESNWNAAPRWFRSPSCFVSLCHTIGSFAGDCCRGCPEIGMAFLLRLTVIPPLRNGLRVWYLCM